MTKAGYFRLCTKQTTKRTKIIQNNNKKNYSCISAFKFYKWAEQQSGGIPVNGKIYKYAIEIWNETCR